MHKCTGGYLMAYIKRVMFAVGILVILSLISIIKHSAALFVLYVFAHFLVLKIFPVFRRCENIWMFVIVAFSTIPVNVYLIILLKETGLFYSFFFLNVLKGILCYIMLFCIEEIFMGIVTRCIWKRQYKNVI